jgi:hypothetical protein
MRPSFFIVGAPKCGTTALSSYLGSHPEIFMCSPKEPYFFADDLPGLPRVAPLARYLALFVDVPREVKLSGEASAVYLFSRVAIARIAEFDRSARIVAMLRNPVDIAHAFHSELLYDSSEDEASFEKAWALQERRSRGEAIPRLCREPQLLQYQRVAELGAQVERLLSIFPSSQVKFVYHEDLAAAPGQVYSEVLQFLGIRDDGRREFPRVNENKEARNQFLATALSRPSRSLSAIAGWARQTLGLKSGILDPLRRLNRRRIPRDELAPGFRSELAAAFRGDLRRLERVVGRDLAHWI